MNWEQKKRIGEALGYHSWDGWDSIRNLSNKDGHRLLYASTEENLWNAYQPDVLGDVIPWLQLNTFSWSVPWNDGYEPWWSSDEDNIANLHFLPRYPMYEQSILALMLAVIEAGVPA